MSGKKQRNVFLNIFWFVNLEGFKLNSSANPFNLVEEETLSLSLSLCLSLSRVKSYYLLSVWISTFYLCQSPVFAKPGNFFPKKLTFPAGPILRNFILHFLLQSSNLVVQKIRLKNFSNFPGRIHFDSSLESRVSLNSLALRDFQISKFENEPAFLSFVSVQLR